VPPAADAWGEGQAHPLTRHVQYHPESSAGPHDSVYLFEEFRTPMG
jgi:carbamoylphosphate synthase small subunit